MKTIRLACVVGVFAAGGAEAQLVAEAASPRLQTEPAARVKPAAPQLAPHSRAYATNDATKPNDKLFTGFRTDPKLVLGYELAPNFALETGLTELHDRGFHRTEQDRPSEAAGAVGSKGFSSYAAARYSLPLDERLSVYGKAGIAYHQRRLRGATDSDTGAYGAVGAQYKLGDKASASAEYQYSGSPAKTFQGANAQGLKAKVGIGF